MYLYLHKSIRRDVGMYGMTQGCVQNLLDCCTLDRCNDYVHTYSTVLTMNTTITRIMYYVNRSSSDRVTFGCRADQSQTDSPRPTPSPQILIHSHHTHTQLRTHPVLATLGNLIHPSRCARVREIESSPIYRRHPQAPAMEISTQAGLLSQRATTG